MKKSFIATAAKARGILRRESPGLFADGYNHFEMKKINRCGDEFLRVTATRSFNPAANHSDFNARHDDEWAYKTKAMVAVVKMLGGDISDPRIISGNGGAGYTITQLEIIVPLVLVADE